MARAMPSEDGREGEEGRRERNVSERIIVTGWWCGAAKSEVAEAGD